MIFRGFDAMNFCRGISTFNHSILPTVMFAGFLQLVDLGVVFLTGTVVAPLLGRKFLKRGGSTP
jgi:hypothetical protein